MNFLITGKNSVFAQSVGENLALRGHEVTLLGRTTIPIFDLENINSEFEKILESNEYLIHFAHSFTKQTNNDLNVIASQNLVKILSKSQIKKCIFISSDSASKNAKSTYGRSKFNSELEFLSSNKSLILRVGIILDENIPSPFRKILRFTRATRILVAPSARKRIFRTTTIEEITESILSGIARDLIGGPFISTRNSDLKSTKQIVNECGIYPALVVSVPMRAIKFFAGVGKKLKWQTRILDSAVSISTPTENCESIFK